MIGWIVDIQIDSIDNHINYVKHRSVRGALY